VASLHIVGIGNTLLGDDGVGPRVVEMLAPRLGDDPDIALIDGGTLGFALTGWLEDADCLIVVDAAKHGRAPGELAIFEDEAMDVFIARRGRSVHEVGLADALDMARLGGRLPARRILIGIEPETVDWGDQLSAPVAAAARRAVSHILSLVDGHRRGPAAPAVCPQPEAAP